MLEVGEELEEAVAREIEEETGIKVEVKELLGVFNFVIRDKNGRVKYHYVLIDFLAKPVGGKLRPSRETLDVRWISLKDVEKYPLTRTTRRLISRAVERGLIKEE
ncbi:MAG: DNA mismatch repair protein MutT [Candidatus Hecatellales archaeon B24]|nr:MAG: DNA mismatch repair protein MutT [Candidatus Hecatellales archaeon B24]